jgi:hypothetical protein
MVMAWVPEFNDTKYSPSWVKGITPDTYAYIMRSILSRPTAPVWNYPVGTDPSVLKNAALDVAFRNEVFNPWLTSNSRAYNGALAGQWARSYWNWLKSGATVNMPVTTTTPESTVESNPVWQDAEYLGNTGWNRAGDMSAGDPIKQHLDALRRAAEANTTTIEPYWEKYSQVIPAATTTTYKPASNLGVVPSWLRNYAGTYDQFMTPAKTSSSNINPSVQAASAVAGASGSGNYRGNYAATQNAGTVARSVAPVNQITQDGMQWQARERARKRIGRDISKQGTQNSYL